MAEKTQAETETPEGQDKNHDVYFVPGLHRGLILLETLAAAQDPMSVSEIARSLGVTRSSAFRLVYTLKHMGFIENEPGTKNVRLGGRVMSLGFSYLASMSIIEIAQPHLNTLRDETGITSHLGIRDGRELLYLATAQSKSGFLSTINVGARFPVQVTPMGWTLMQDMTEAEITALFPGGTWPAITEQSPTDIASLMARIEKARADGYVVSKGMLEAGGQSMVAPVRDATGKVVASIDVSGPDSAFPGEDDGRVIQHLLDAAKRISMHLGGTP